MSTSDAPAGFVRGNERLTKILADPDTRTSVDEILAEQDQIDRRTR